MATATFNGRVIAQSDDIVVVEGNPYFPLDSLDSSVVTTTEHTTHCPWKGDAAYYTVEVDGAVAENAAWYYPVPKDGAEQVANRVAFYPAITVDA